jgi:hypothetical protein
MKMRPSAVLLPVVLFICSPARAQTQNLFLQPPAFACTGQTVAADFNGDGKPDLVCQDGSVLLGNGDGTFKTGTPWSVTGQSGANQVLTADFNGDGKPDLFVTFVSSTFIYVLLGNGDGTFQTAVGTNIGLPLGSPIAVDVNADGKADVLGASGAQLFVFLGKGDGTFAPAVTYPSYSNLMTVGDFNGDGKVDIAQAVGSVGGVSGTGTVAVFLGNGDGTFRSAITSPGVDFPTAIKAGDLNGDAKMDILVSNDGFIPSGSSPQTFTLLGNGDGTFQAPGAPVPAAVGDLALVDLNGDGKLDLVVLGDPFTQIFLGNGDGTFALKYFYLDVDYISTTGLVTADFNGDGKPDLAFANKILIGNGAGSFQDNPASPIGSFPLMGAVSGDFNGDGIPDVAAISVSASRVSNLDILLNDGTGAFSIAHTYTLPLPAYSIATADLNGDGKLDLIIVTVDPITNVWTLNILLGNGDGTFGAATTYSQTSDSSVNFWIAVADFNGDHKPDLAILNLQGSTVNVFLNHGDGTFAPSSTYFAGVHAVSLLVGDFNSDGKTDIVTSSDAGLGLLVGNSDGTFQAATFPYSAIGQLVAAADLNNDGNLDLIAENQIFLGNGDGTFSALPPNGVNVTPDVKVADVNGDGKLDLVTTPGVQVLLGNGDGTFGSPVTVFSGPSVRFRRNQVATSFLLTGDFRHNGHTDIVVDAVDISGNASTGVVTFLNTAQPQTPDFLLSSKALTPASVAPGNSATSTVTLTSIGGFTGSVTLSCTGLPSGASCNFSPSSLASPGSSALTIDTTSSTPVGTYPVAVTGAASSLSHGVALTLVVATSSGATTLTVAPVTLTFTPQALGSTSSPQAVQLSNIGSAALTISSVSITGTNASDFALQNNTCATGIAAGANCQLAVTFTPGGTGPRNATISVTDNATGSPHMVVLNGAGPDFSLSPSTAQTVTVSAGKTATYTVAVTPSGGFNQSVSFTCSGAPATTTCTVSPDPILLNGTVAANATVTISTMAPSLAPPSPFRIDFRHPNTLRSSAAFALALLMIAIICSRRQKNRLSWGTVATIALSVFLVTALSSCGGGSSGTKPTSPGTQSGTYSVTVTGTFTSGSSSTTHATNLTLVVQ